MVAGVNPGRFHSLTILRFFAAAWVLVFHLNKLLTAGAAQPWAALLDNGALAMGFFFTLSGAALAYGYGTLTPNASDIRRFYLARFARIYPAYAVLHLSALFFVDIPFPEEAGRWLYVHLLSFLGLQAWFGHAAIQGVNTGTWSLSTEFFFYALFPLLLPLLRTLRDTLSFLRLAFGVCLLVGTVGAADLIFQTAGGFTPYYYNPALRLPEFMLGVLIGLELARPSPLSRPALLAGLLLSTLGILIVAFLPNRNLWMSVNAVFTPLAAAVIYFFAQTERTWAPDWKNPFLRLLRYLGESSYCLFLVHLFPLFALSTPAAAPYCAAFLREYHRLWFWALFAAGSLLLAFALHELVEKPARRWIMRRWGDGVTPSP